jgi:glucose repression mediator protein
MNDTDGATMAYEAALRHNRYSVAAMLAIANILRSRDNFGPAIEYLKAITKFEERNGEVWASLGKSEKFQFYHHV